MQYDGSTASNGHSFQAHVGPMRSPSRGSVKLQSVDPYHNPKIQFNYMSHETDRFSSCIAYSRIFAQEAFQPFVGKKSSPVQIVKVMMSWMILRDNVESATTHAAPVNGGSKQPNDCC